MKLLTEGIPFRGIRTPVLLVENFTNEFHEAVRRAVMLSRKYGEILVVVRDLEEDMDAIRIRYRDGEYDIHINVLSFNSELMLPWRRARLGRLALGRIGYLEDVAVEGRSNNTLRTFYAAATARIRARSWFEAFSKTVKAWPILQRLADENLHAVVYVRDVPVYSVG